MNCTLLVNTGGACWRQVFRQSLGYRMKSAQYAKYFIRIILAICVMAIIFTIFHIFTPKIDVFSSVGVHWLADKPQEVTCTFNPENFVEEVLQVKPRANLQDVENLAKSIQVQVDIIDSPEGVDDPYRIDYRLTLVQYDKRLQKKIGIQFYNTSRESYM